MTGRFPNDAKLQGPKIRAPESTAGLELELEQAQDKGDGVRQ